MLVQLQPGSCREMLRARPHMRIPSVSDTLLTAIRSAPGAPRSARYTTAAPSAKKVWLARKVTAQYSRTLTSPSSTSSSPIVVRSPAISSRTCKYVFFKSVFSPKNCTTPDERLGIETVAATQSPMLARCMCARRTVPSVWCESFLIERINVLGVIIII